MMEFTTHALYKNGILQLEQDLDLPDNTPVKIQVRPITQDELQDDAFEQEVAAFNRLKPQLHQKYSGQVVAIYQGQVIAVGPDKKAVFNEVLDQYGEIICYLEWVEPETPRRVRMPSIHIIRE